MAVDQERIAKDLLDFQRVISTLEKEYQELMAVDIAPRVDYSRAGVVRLAEAVGQARASSQRSAQLAAKSRRLRRQCEAVLDGHRAAYQDAYDQEVVRNVTRMSEMSWEERASSFRVRVIDQALLLRPLQVLMANVQALDEAIATLSQAIFRARGDLSTLADVMRFGDRLGEVT